MKVLIQDLDSWRFLSRHGKWTDRDSDALHFPSAIAALMFVLDHELQHVELILRFNGPEYDIRLPVPAQQ